MSRIPPVPSDSSRRARVPSLPNGSSTYAGGLPATRPLNISRPPSRPTTPNTTSSPPTGSSFMPSKGPFRPQRSELRTRPDYASSERTSTSSRITVDTRDRRDSSSTTRSDVSAPQRSRDPGSSRTIASNTRNSKLRQESPRSIPQEVSEISPTSVAAVLAFQSAGRKRGMTNGSQETEREREKQAELEKEKERQERMKQRVAGRRVNRRARTGDIEAVLDQIKDEWNFVIESDFNNVDLALQLLDDSSNGKNMQSFQETKAMLARALKGSVDKHYQAFAASLPHHASLLSHLNLTQAQVSEARATLQDAKDALGTKRADLVQMWTRSQMLEEMMRMLDQIEHLKSVPDLLETLMSEKRLLQASVLLVRSLKTINKQEMQEIGAVADLRSYLVGQESALREILIDELHNHLYLKSFWCETRWAVYTPGQESFPNVDFEAELFSYGPTEDPPRSPTSPKSPTSNSSRLLRYIYGLTVRPNDPPYDQNAGGFNSSGSAQELPSSTLPSAASALSSSNISQLLASAPQVSQTSANPESDSFAYIETLLESLAVLGKLGNALDIMGQRLHGEIYSLIETTLDEVEERAEESKRRSMFEGSSNSRLRSGGSFILSSNDPTNGVIFGGIGPTMVSQSGISSASILRLAALESSTRYVDQEILKDFFWTLYSKIVAVTQGLRVVYEVANRIGSRRDYKDSSGAKPGALFPLTDIWLPMQAEVRTLLNDYLTDAEQGSSSGRSSLAAINEVLREGKFVRDKSKPLFRFAETDARMLNKSLKKDEDELTRVLRDIMPGLVQNTSDSAVQATLSSLGTDDRLGVEQHHRLLIRPDAFHVTVLFQPTLAFLHRINDILPPGVEGTQSASEVLDDFVLKVYLPQLQEKVSSLFQQSVSGPDAFRSDPFSNKLSPHPLYRASVQLMALVNSLCSMLRRTPFHRENYSRLILGVIIQFYQRCSDRFQDLVSVSNSGDPLPTAPVALATQWAQKSELNPCLSELFATSEADISKRQRLCQQETHLECSFLGQASVGKTDLISSTRNLAALCSLYHSVVWFVDELNILKAIPEDALSPTTPVMRSEPVSAIAPNWVPVDPTEQLSLPLSREMAMRFGALVKTYNQLAELILHTIRIDIRCRTFHYLDAALRLGNYRIDHEAGQPDAYVVDLNNDLNECDAFIRTALPEREQQFVFVGLGQLMEHLLVSNARYIKSTNNFGIKKIMRNILALQQSIKTIGNGQQLVEFERAKSYYSLFFLMPQGMLEKVREKQVFSFDEYKIMLDLQCGIDRSKGEAAINAQKDRDYSMYVIELHGMELENSGDADGRT